MRIGLISDTHMPVDAIELPKGLSMAFRDVDLIMHAGDVYSPSVLEELETIAPLWVCKGDDDYGDILDDNRLKEEHRLEYEGVVIHLVHEFVIESYRGGTGSEPTPTSGEDAFPDIVVYGHTHKPSLDHRGAFLTVTAGSATFPNYVREPGTVGLLTLRSGKAEARIIQL